MQLRTRYVGANMGKAIDATCKLLFSLILSKNDQLTPSQLKFLLLYQTSIEIYNLMYD